MPYLFSTIAVFFSPAYSEVKIIRDSEEPLHSPDADDNYSRSRWVAEKLVRIARDRDIPVSIYRPTMIIGHSQTGVFQINDSFSRIIKGCIQLGIVPTWDNGMVNNMIPVDYTSRAIIYLSLQPKCLGKTFHLVNPVPNNCISC